MNTSKTIFTYLLTDKGKYWKDVSVERVSPLTVGSNKTVYIVEIFTATEQEDDATDYAGVRFELEEFQKTINECVKGGSYENELKTVRLTQNPVTPYLFELTKYLMKQKYAVVLTMCEIRKLHEIQSQIKHICDEDKKIQNESEKFV